MAIKEILLLNTGLKKQKIPKFAPQNTATMLDKIKEQIAEVERFEAATQRLWKLSGLNILEEMDC